MIYHRLGNVVLTSCIKIWVTFLRLTRIFHIKLLKVKVKSNCLLIKLSESAEIDPVVTCDNLLNAYSSFYRLKKAVAWLNRFFNYLKFKVVDSTHCQILRSSRLIKLQPILVDGILRVGG